MNIEMGCLLSKEEEAIALIDRQHAMNVSNCSIFVGVMRLENGIITDVVLSISCIKDDANKDAW